MISLTQIIKNPRLLRLRHPVASHHIPPPSPMHPRCPNNYNRIFYIIIIYER